MPISLRRVSFAILLCSVAIPTFFVIVNRSAFFQGRDKVVVRECGRLRLGRPQPDPSFAADELPFALLSEAAYDEIIAEKPPTDVSGDCKPMVNKEAESKLLTMGWCPWNSAFLDKDRRAFFKHNLRVSVWQNPSLNEVVVNFGGTNPHSLADWIANFRWFIPVHDDEYTEVTKAFVGDFARAYQTRAVQPGSEFLQHATIIATGHSLGGGLAQEFAYAQYRLPGVPPVKKVYAFDASPVTGYFSVDKKARDENSQNLYTDRVYERREILAILRAAVNLFHRPNVHNPQIREIRFDFKSKENPIVRHSIPDLRRYLESVVGTDWREKPVEIVDDCLAK